MRRMSVMAATTLALLPSLVVLRPGAQTVAADWPQYLGPQCDGVYRGPALGDTWGSSGPKVVWTKPVGQGFSGPVVADGRLILFHRVGDREVVQSLDARTGAEQWSYGYPTSYRDDFGFDEGPRAVPVVANGIVYTFGAEAHLHAGVGATIAGKRYAIFLTRAGLVGLDPATGAVQFQKRWRARQNASVNAATPLVVGDLIFISAEYGPGAA